MFVSFSVIFGDCDLDPHRDSTSENPFLQKPNTKWAKMCQSKNIDSKKSPTGPTFHRPRKNLSIYIAQSQLTFHGVRWDSAPFNF